MFNKFIYLPLSLVMITGFVSAQQKPFTVSGTIKDTTDAFIYMYYSNGEGKNTIDSSFIRNGKFSFHGQLSGPAQASVVVDKQTRSIDKYLQLYIVPGDMQLSLEYNNFRDAAVLKGSSVQKEADALNKAKAPVMQKLKPLSLAYDKANMEYIAARNAKKDEVTLERLKNAATEAKDAMDPYYEEMRKIDQLFMDKNPSSFVTASMLRYSISDMSLTEGEMRYSKLSETVKNSNLGKELKKDLDGLRMGSTGAKAYIFASTELRGTPLSLADYKGKYVLVDFWASWCVPCRKGNPHLLSLYSKYKDKGFEIIGISDDDNNNDAWKKAVEKDQIGVWKHVLRGLKWNGNVPDRSTDISDNYGIHSLPTKILIDPNGVIIGRYGGGGENDEAMDKKFKEIFGE